LGDRVIRMSLTRKLEVISGVMTALLGIVAATQMLGMNMETARRLERNFPLVQEFLGALVLYALPGLLVAIQHHHLRSFRIHG